MKKIYSALVSIFIATLSIAQINLRQDETLIVPNKNVHSLNPTQPSSAFLGKAVFEKTECITKEDMQIIQKQIDDNIAMLRSKNPNACKKTSLVHPLFIWPTQPKAGFTDYGYYTVQYLIDHDPIYNNHVLDYNCGSRTYDWVTGNHMGTDIILWPYAWRRMDEQVEEVVAAAPGVIVNKVDGFYDRNCAMSGATNRNSIYVQHDDGSVAWYLHFKNGSLTAKNVGDSVVAGEYLASAGSSGGSSWPHLHFQVMDSNGNVIDPWDGACNNFNGGDTWWLNQQTYEVPSINRICTKNTQLDYYICPNPEITYEKDTFNIGDSLWLWIYTRDLQLNSTMQINIYNPSSQNVINFPFTVPWPTTPTTYVRWTYNIVDAWWTQGWWKFEVVYNGNTYYHMFYMTHSATGVAKENTSDLFSVSPNPATDEINIMCNPTIENSTLTVMDALGKEVYSSVLSIGQNKIQTHRWNNGVYTLQLKSGKGVTTQKIIIQH